MKTIFTQQNTFKTYRLLGLCFIAFLTFSISNAQSQNQSFGRIVKGKITDEIGPLEDATVLLKGTNIYATTDKDGTFTFPRTLNVNDKLVISALGFKDKEVTIKPNTSFIETTMADYEIVIVGDLQIGNNNTIKTDN